MAKLETAIEVRCTKYYVVFFPIATYKRIGNVSILTVFGVPVYKRVDRVRSLCGFSWIGVRNVKPT